MRGVMYALHSSAIIKKAYRLYLINYLRIIYIMNSFKIKKGKKMAYNRKNKETKLYHLNDNKIKKIQNFQKKFWKDWLDLYMNLCVAYDTPELTDDEFYIKLHELLGSKRYKGRPLKLLEQYKIKNSFKRLYYRTTTKNQHEPKISELFYI